MNKKPWDLSAIAPPSRVVHLRNLPPKCGWEEISVHFETSTIEQHHIFNNQALIQFESADDAKLFLEQNNGKIEINGTIVQAQLSNYPILNSSSDALFNGKTGPSKVICIQLVHLRIFMSMFDIYDECSKYGTVQKIICFERSGNFSLVQMSSLKEAASVLANLHNNPKHLPNFQMKVQYSKNQDLIVKINNAKSFNFMPRGALQQFNALREHVKNETPFFEPEPSPSVSPIFDIWRPVHFDPLYSQVLCVTNLDETKSACDPLRNLFSLYGHVQRVKVLYKNRRTAFVQMGTGFFGRIAALFLHDCPFAGRKLQIAFSSHVEVTPLTEPGSEGLYQEYGDGPIDLTIEQYKHLYFPSEYVEVNGVPLEELLALVALPKEVQVLQKYHALHFPSVQDAVGFIAVFNGTVFNGRTFMLNFMRKPDSVI
ncbi:polypyrimidine tract-binding protein 3 [Histomonas meleagridis]|uniref:polypyrimidine tract-binding protein 3 n=1 Tax=Histomonas meleagridis TaxID=135588 RepID=UPI003559D048|nr:polypyrimidine tract-binding protein 3 [Histomonas meleagridis]KAH0802738.1 polypyrimidine tract-binding protein 3 [Histomonas meleagridis]